MLCYVVLSLERYIGNVKGRLIGNDVGLSVEDMTYTPRRHLAAKTTSGPFDIVKYDWNKDSKN
jgi:hypothetical protein